jgi:hypothetical protein
MGGRMFFSVNGAGTTGYTHSKEINLGPYLTPYKKIS